MLSLALLLLGLLVGCDRADNDTGDDPNTVGDDDSSTVEDLEFELLGSWDYTGGFAGLTNTLVFSEDQLEDTGEYQGTSWTIHYDLLS